MNSGNYRKLTKAEIRGLESFHCRADDWGKVWIADPFDPNRVQNVVFQGEVRLGRLDGIVRTEKGSPRHAGLYRVTLENVTVGDNVLISGVTGYIANYDIGPCAVVQGVGVLEADPGATFGNGTLVEAVNEAGGRGVPIYEELSAQTAYLMAMHRYQPQMVERLLAMVEERVARAGASRATIGEKAVVRNIPHIENVVIGPGAEVIGALRLKNGTIRSELGAPTTVGNGVTVRNFIVGEGAHISGGAILERVFVGQGVRIGKHYSAENCLFFANSEFLHGEACSVFAGPYSVSHHKSTLLIAGLFSFYNAGSGSNQSNHMYKLGPVHEGVLERGSKTGSFSYLLWPCRIGPFSVVLGKHMANVDLRNLPFSYVEAGDDGKSRIAPGMNLFTVGTVRDGEKWPSRDRRTATVKRDLIIFDVLSPYTVERMMAGEALCSKLYGETPRSIEEISFGGAVIRRLLLRIGAKSYKTGIEAYLLGAVVGRVEGFLETAKGFDKVQAALAEEPGAVDGDTWVDIAGLLAPKERIQAVEEGIASGRLASLDAADQALRDVHGSYGRDAWAWVCRTYAKRFGKAPGDLSAADLEKTAADWGKTEERFIKAVLADTEKEFSEISRIGFGADGDEKAQVADFEAVRGTFESNSFVRKLKARLALVGKRVSLFQERLARLES